jgi:hypothetical protein
VVTAYNRLVKGSAVRQSPIAFQQNRVSMNAPPKVQLEQESFVIASVKDLRAYMQDGNAAMFSTQSEAYQKQQELLLEHPELEGQIQVVSHYELVS